MPRPIPSQLRLVIMLLSVILTGALPGAPTPPTDPTNSEPKLPSEIPNAIVTITGDHGIGSGFICTLNGKTYVATNQHVFNAGFPMTIRARKGAKLEPAYYFVATDADIALIQCAKIPPEIKPLQITKLSTSAAHAGDEIIIPEIDQRTGGITEIPGKLLDFTAQKIEISNLVHPGNSGSPIVATGSHQVIGILTYAELAGFHQFEKAPLGSKEISAGKQPRYFGCRIDAIEKWEPLRSQTFQNSETLIQTSKKELRELYSLFTGSNDWKNFPELRAEYAAASAVFDDTTRTAAEKKAAYEHLLQSVESLAKRATQRLDGHTFYFSQQQEADAVKAMSEAVIKTSASALSSDRLADILAHMSRGN